LLVFYNSLAALRLSLYNFGFHLTRFVFVVGVCSLQLFRTSCALSEGYGTNLQGLGKTRPRVEVRLADRCACARPPSTEADALTTRSRAGCDPKSQPFLYTAKSKRASATAGAPISKSHKKWSYWSVESAPTRPYVCNTWSPHLPWVCGTHNSNPGIKIEAFLRCIATIIHFWLS